MSGLGSVLLGLTLSLASSEAEDARRLRTLAAVPEVPQAPRPLVSYERSLAAVQAATFATNTEPERGAIQLEVALRALLDHSPRLSSDQEGQRLQLLGELALARVALLRGEELRAATIMDRLLTIAELSGSRGEFDEETIGPRLSQLLRERRAEDLGAWTRLRVHCSGPCAVFVDGRAVKLERVAGDGVPLSVGEHVLWIEEGTRPRREWLEVDSSGELLERSTGASVEPPPPSLAAGTLELPPASMPAGPTRGEDRTKAILPRWLEIAGVVTGAGLGGASASLLVLDGRCVGGGSPSGPNACANLHQTQAGGVALAAAGATTLLTSAILLAIDERRRAHVNGEDGHD
ncbi:hypothetical protein PPSIR1_23066 [Plesiocystis pacifica SIR-1]|uniref:Uncharacterized protein n=1 Tax=Plesiocystis pacifica SIR-1 TaxID=391625 RepID=A6G2N6_9BACT|nr:hypothetical protein PPSIR1_23066 [Plesiocystis pacifica SIR-1]